MTGTSGRISNISSSLSISDADLLSCCPFSGNRVVDTDLDGVGVYSADSSSVITLELVLGLLTGGDVSGSGISSSNSTAAPAHSNDDMPLLAGGLVSGRGILLRFLAVDFCVGVGKPFNPFRLICIRGLTGEGIDDAIILLPAVAVAVSVVAVIASLCCFITSGLLLVILSIPESL